MVKTQNNNISKGIANQGEKGCSARASKIGAFTAYEYCSKQLSHLAGFWDWRSLWI